MELLKRMNNHHQNTRIFIGDWTHGFTHQLNTGRERQEGVVGESENKTREKSGEGEGVWSEFGQ